MGDDFGQLDDELEAQEVEVEHDPLELPSPTDLHEAQWDADFDKADSTALVPFGLTPRQWLFVCEYFKDFSVTKALARAGYSIRSTSAPTRIMRRPRVRDAIRWMMIERAKLYAITQDRIYQELAVIAFSDPHDYAQWCGNKVRWRDSMTIPVHKRRAVRSIKHSETVGKYGTTESTEIKFEPKIKALELLMKATGMLRETESVDNRGAFKRWMDAQMSGEIPPARPALPGIEALTEKPDEDDGE